MPTSDSTKGELLKQVRESKGVTLESVHEATKIPMDALRAIEEGYTVRTLSSFYYKGFLKIYAQYLGIDVTKVVDDDIDEKPQSSKDLEKDDVDIKENIDLILTPERKQFIGKIIGIIIILFLFSKFIGFVKGVFTSKPQKIVTEEKKKTKKEKEMAQRAVKTVASQGADVPQAAVAKAKKKKIPVAQTITLTVKAKKNSWLRVKTDGSVVFQSTLKQGSSETWSGKERIELSGKNINQLEFELNGKLIGSLGRADRNARKLIVTKDGLAIKK